MKPSIVLFGDPLTGSLKADKLTWCYRQQFYFTETSITEHSTSRPANHTLRRQALTTESDGSNGSGRESHRKWDFAQINSA